MKSERYVIGVDFGTLSGRATIGVDARDAVKAAVMAEDVARTIHIARKGGELVPLSPETVSTLFDRYQNVYGQVTAEERR